MENSIYTGLKYSTKEINLNFKIKVHTVNKYGKNLNTLVGVSGLIRLVDDIDIVNRIIEKTFASGADRKMWKLRRGLRVTFYSH